MSRRRGFTGKKARSMQRGRRRLTTLTFYDLTHRWTFIIEEYIPLSPGIHLSFLSLSFSLHIFLLIFFFSFFLEGRSIDVEIMITSRSSPNDPSSIAFYVTYCYT